MDNKANTILSSVISNHGKQLLTSNAFCKVYLSGYLADYPQEKQLLIALKEQEIPKAFLDFKENRITEVDLQNFINAHSKNSTFSHTATAWGVDAWATATGLSQTVKLNLLRQCFGYTDPVLDFTILPPQTASVDSQQHSPSKWGSTVAASLVALAWMIPSQELSSYTPIENQVTTTLKETKIVTPEPMTIEQLRTRTLKTKQLTAAIDAYLQSGPKSN